MRARQPDFDTDSTKRVNGVHRTWLRSPRTERALLIIALVSLFVEYLTILSAAFYGYADGTMTWVLVTTLVGAICYLAATWLKVSRL